MAIFARSPALTASRPPNLIDPHTPAEYPVVLGEGLENHETSSAASLSMRYNWKIQKPTSISRMHLEKSKSSTDHSYDLIIEDHGHRDRPYRYAGHASGTPVTRNGKGENDSKSQSLALLWDTTQSAFQLEPISSAIDFNLTSAPEQSQREVSAHKKLPMPSSKDQQKRSEGREARDPRDSDSDSEPDPDNPYDYRHFLAEARVNIASSATPVAGSRTPVPGSRTPIPGSRTPIPGSRTPIPESRTPLPNIPSPALGAHKSTPQFHATSTTTTKKRKVDRPAATQKAKTQSTARKTPSSSTSKQPLSAERIIDSDDDEADQLVIERAAASASKSTSTSNHRKQLSGLNSLSSSQSQPHSQPSLHHRVGSGVSGGGSPHLIVSDADAELEIDLGSPSPPPVASKYTQRKRPQHAVNPDAFSGRNRGVGPRGGEDAMRRDARNEEGEDVEMRDVDGDGDVDGDVEELELGSPRSGTHRAVGRHSDVVDEEGEEMVEDDDDGLAAELEAALEEEGEDGEEGVGLGLGISAGKEDESEVSEEE